MVVNADQGYLGTGTAGTYQDAAFPLQGTITIRNFQWPETWAAGLAYQATPKVLVVADIKRIRWRDVMEDFRMSFKANNSASNGAFAGLTLNATLPQNWDDQTVIQLGASYAADDHWTLRAGYNGASNPVPDSTVHYLFPATVEQHYTAGAGYRIDKDKAINASLSFSPATKVTSADGLDISHSQSNWQVMYSQHY
jgi:long-chain fatty acid transport protein